MLRQRLLLALTLVPLLVIIMLFISITLNDWLFSEKAEGEDQYELVEVVSGFERPVYLTHAGDKRLFIVEQAGLVKIIQDGEVLPEPFLDVRDKVTRGHNEQGLLSIAFQPDAPRYFFINYTGKDGGTTHIERYQVSADDPNRADPASMENVLSIEQPYGNHNGGLLKFGTDGYLYIGMGDGGSAGDPENRADDLSKLLGKMLRIDVSALPYRIPPDNPFIDDPTAQPEIWAYGLRNPWRFSFDRLRHDLYIADVGQNAIEEVNFQPADSLGGEHYGWRLFEGNRPYTYEGDLPANNPYTFPIHDYEHNALIPVIETQVTGTAHCSVTGGYVYRGAKVPGLVGHYLYGDYCSGYLWSLVRDDAGNWQNTLLLKTDLTITSFGEDVDGEFYLVSFPGTVYQLQEK